MLQPLSWGQEENMVGWEQTGSGLLPPGGLRSSQIQPVVAAAQRLSDHKGGQRFKGKRQTSETLQPRATPLGPPGHRLRCRPASTWQGVCQLLLLVGDEECVAFPIFQEKLEISTFTQALSILNMNNLFKIPSTPSICV